MIARLRGRVLAVETSALIVEVGGVGYRVYVPAGLLGSLRPGEGEIELHTHLHVRETEMALFGAEDAVTLRLFEQLLKVNGVGPKVALAVLSTLSAEALRHAILSEDIGRLTEVPGIGRKTAQRIVLDLKGSLEEEGAGPAPDGAALAAGGEDEAVAALMSLGYSRGEARRALAAVDPGESLEQRIVLALRGLAEG